MSPALRVLLQNSASFVAFRSFGASQTSLKAPRLTRFEAKTEVGFKCPRALATDSSKAVYSHKIRARLRPCTLNLSAP